MMRYRPLIILTALLAFQVSTSVLTADVIISEIDSINIGSATDRDGNDRDWIELHNTGASSVNLSGWALSDDPGIPDMWIFPDVSIGAGAHLLVFASGKDWRVPSVELHTNFKLSSGGGDVVLSQPGGGGWTTMDSITAYPSQRPGLSYGRAGSTASGTLGYFESPTPGAQNGDTVVVEFVADTDFDHTRGFYDTPFDLNIQSATPGATIVYTLDGTEPSLNNGVQVSAASEQDIPIVVIPVSTTTYVRARAYKEGLGSTNIDTHTFLFAADVLAQSASSIPGTSVNWGHAGPDWEMDPRVTENTNPEDRCVPEDLMKIPTVSVVMDWVELFGTSESIYVKGEGVRKPASFEILNPGGLDENPNTSPAEHARGNILVFGGSSTGKRWKTDKLSFRFNFDQDLDSVVLGEGAVGTYDRLVLDARLNNVWTQSQNFEQRQFGDYTRDAILTDLEQKIGVKSVHSQHVHLFLNGIYWGLYTLHERPDKHFAAEYFGGDKDDWDVVKHDPGADNFLVDGARIDPTREISNANHTAGVHYLNMVDLAREDLTVQANYDALAAVLDIPALVDHILVNFYGGNYDWPQHNWYASRNRADPEGKWRFHSWDAEHVFKYVDYPRYDNVTNKFEGWDRPDGINLQLLENPEYRFLFADTVHKYMFNNGPFSVDRVWSLFEKRFDDIDEAIRAESARWGDSGQQGDSSRKEVHLRYTNVPSTNPPDPRQSDTTDYASWYHERNRIRTMILGPEPNRATRFLDQLRDAVYHEDHPKDGQSNPMYPETDAPVFSQHGGVVPDAGLQLSMINPNPGGAGILYYTTDGSDPREPFTGNGAFFSGDVADTATEYSGSVSLSTTIHVKARVLLNGEWSALNEAVFTFDPAGSIPATVDNLVISEIHYHPTDPTNAEVAAGYTDESLFEYFEVMNTGTSVVSLEGLEVEQGLDIAVFDADSIYLAPGNSVVFVADPEAFGFRYGNTISIAGQFMGGTGLSNAGERLHLLAADGSTIVDFSYEDDEPWPLGSDGDGASLVLMQPGYRDPQYGWNWRASLVDGGTPGTVEDLPRQDEWTDDNFSPDDPGYPDSSLPGADPDMDGLTNLEERFFGTDPWSLTPPEAIPQISLETLDFGHGAALHAVLTFTYIRNTEDILFMPRTFTGLDAGNADELFLLDDPVNNGDGTETRHYYTPSTIEDDHDRWFSLYLELR